MLRSSSREVERIGKRKAGLSGGRPLEAVSPCPAPRCSIALAANRDNRRYSPVTWIETVSISCGCCAASIFKSFGREK
jgi:hypothetical protein